jgi:hypothetical protein
VIFVCEFSKNLLIEIGLPFIPGFGLAEDLGANKKSKKKRGVSFHDFFFTNKISLQNKTDYLPGFSMKYTPIGYFIDISLKEP